MKMQGYAPGQFAGKSILEQLWEELDAVMDRLMSEDKPDQEALGEALNDGQDRKSALEEAGKWFEEIKSWGETRGQAQGLAYAIAVMTDPYEPKVPAVKKTAKKRWEARQDG